MSDIERFFPIWVDGVMMPANNGKYVRYDDHRAKVERVMADVVKLRIELNSAQVEASQRRGEVDRLTAERDEALGEVERVTARQTEMETHISGLTAELHRTRADGIELRWVEGEVQQLTAQRDAAQAEVERLTQERDEARADRDAAQRERERVQGLLWLRGRELPTLQRDQPAQNLDMANGQAILDRSRPDDETIWREAFMSQLHDRYGEASELAEVALAGYRKRWPR